MKRKDRNQMEAQSLGSWSLRLGFVGMVVLLLVFAELMGVLLVGNPIFLGVVEVLLAVCLLTHWRMQFLAFEGKVRRRYFLYVIPLAARVVFVLLLSVSLPFGTLLSMGLVLASDGFLLTGLIRMVSELTKDPKPTR